MAGVYSVLRAFFLEHRDCGELRGDADPITGEGYRVWARCFLWGQPGPVGHAGGCGGGSAAVSAAHVRELTRLTAVRGRSGRVRPYPRHTTGLPETTLTRVGPW